MHLNLLEFLRRGDPYEGEKTNFHFILIVYIYINYVYLHTC